MNNTTSSSSIGIGGIVFCIFLVLKLTKVITWSWWWVTCPLWIGFAIIVVTLIVAFFIAILSTKRR